MHSTSQSQCGSANNTRGRSHGQLPCCRRLKSLLSHFEECLWLSLEGSSQGWRKPGREGVEDSKVVKKLEKGWGGDDLYSSLICDRTAKVGRQRSKAPTRQRECGNTKGLEITDASLHHWLLIGLSRLPKGKKQNKTLCQI